MAMSLQKYISSTGLGLMGKKDRVEHLADVLGYRLAQLKKLGVPHRQALKVARMGTADKGMPNYQHRSFVADVYPQELLPPAPFTFTNNLSKQEGQRVIDDYLKRYPKPKLWVSDDV